MTSKNTVDELVKRYEAWEAGFQRHQHEKEYQNALDVLSGLNPTPKDLEAFMDVYRISQDKEHFFSSGLFVSAIIQRSYDSGHNGFLVDLSTIDKELILIGANLKGYEENPVSVHVIGCNRNHKSVGIWSLYSTFTIDGHIGHSAGAYTQHSTFHIKGDAGFKSGSYASNCEFIVEGNVGSHFAFWAEDSTFTIHGKREKCFGLGAKNCGYYLKKP